MSVVVLPQLMRDNSVQPILMVGNSVPGKRTDVLMGVRSITGVVSFSSLIVGVQEGSLPWILLQRYFYRPQS